MPIHYIKGDATLPIGEGRKIIAHVCNDQGAWGAGFSGAITRRFGTGPKEYYKYWISIAESGKRFIPGYPLGGCPIAAAYPERLPTSSIYIACLIAQHGYRGLPGFTAPYIRYDALRTALTELQKVAAHKNATVHMPRIGCGLAGGTWDKVEPIIHATLIDITPSSEVYVYDLE